MSFDAIAVDFYPILGYHILYFIAERRYFMKKERVNKSAKLMTRALNVVLRAEANSTACFVAYQPKAPESLSRFRREK